MFDMFTAIAKYLLIHIISTILILDASAAFDRTLSVVKLECDNATYTHCDKLVIVKARSIGDTLYYMWDFGSKPTFLIAQVPSNTNVTVDWDRFANYSSNSVHFTSSPTLVFGTVLNKLYEFNTANNTTITYGAENFQWKVTEVVDVVSKDRVIFSNEGYLRNVSNSGCLKISTCAYGSDGKAVNTPHLLHSANSSQIDMVLDKFKNSFAYSKFAFEFITFSSIGNSTDDVRVQKTMDDENTPGVFDLDTISIRENRNVTKRNGGYLQWRPIVYTTTDNLVASSVKTTENVTDVINKHEEIFNATLLQAIYGSRVSEFFVKALTVKLGSKTDGSYELTNYTSWSFVLGVGDEPQLPFSVIVLSVIIVGVGLPVSIVVISIAFFIYRKVSRSQLERF